MTMKRYNIDHTDASASERVISALSAATGNDPLNLKPLADSIDPDAIDRLFQDQQKGTQLSFSHDGLQIQIDGSEEIVIHSDRE